jgi:hypothetical protein
MRPDNDDVDTGLVIDTPREIAQSDERAAAWTDSASDRPLFVRRAPLTRAQFEAARHGGAVPIRIYRRGYAQYIADFAARQTSAGAQLNVHESRAPHRHARVSAV